MKYCIVSTKLFNQNCILAWCELTSEAVVVDPGGDVGIIYEKINILKINVKKILLTHGHIDHVNNAIELKKYYKIPIIGPNEQDKFLLNNLDLQCRMLGINIPKYHIVVPDVWLKDNDIIKMGHEIFVVLHCPGHSPGHVVFWNKIRKFIFMGDILFKGSIGRTDLFGGNYDALICAIKHKLFTLSDDIQFIPGHGPLSSLGEERKNNVFIV